MANFLTARFWSRGAAAVTTATTTIDGETPSSLLSTATTTGSTSSTKPYKPSPLITGSSDDDDDEVDEEFPTSIRSSSHSTSIQDETSTSNKDLVAPIIINEISDDDDEGKDDWDKPDLSATAASTSAKLWQLPRRTRDNNKNNNNNNNSNNSNNKGNVSRDSWSSSESDEEDVKLKTSIQLKNAKEEIKKLQSSEAALKHKLEQVTQEMNASMSNNMTKNKEDIAELETEIDALKSTVVFLRTSNDTLKKQVALATVSPDEQCAKMEEELTDLRNKLKFRDAQIQRLEAEVADKSNEKSNGPMQGLMEALNDTRIQLLALEDKSEQERCSFRDRISILEEQHRQMTAAVEVAQTRSMKLQSQLDSTEEKRRRLEEDLNCALVTMGEQARELSGVSNSAAMMAELEKAQNTIRQQAREIMQLTEELEEVRNQEEQMKGVTADHDEMLTAAVANERENHEKEIMLKDEEIQRWQDEVRRLEREQQPMIEEQQMIIDTETRELDVQRSRVRRLEERVTELQEQVDVLESDNILIAAKLKEKNELCYWISEELGSTSNWINQLEQVGDMLKAHLYQSTLNGGVPVEHQTLLDKIGRLQEMNEALNVQIVLEKDQSSQLIAAAAAKQQKAEAEMDLRMQQHNEQLSNLIKEVQHEREDNHNKNEEMVVNVSELVAELQSTKMALDAALTQRQQIQAEADDLRAELHRMKSKISAEIAEFFPSPISSINSLTSRDLPIAPDFTDPDDENESLRDQLSSATKQAKVAEEGQKRTQEMLEALSQGSSNMIRTLQDKVAQVEDENFNLQQEVQKLKGNGNDQVAVVEVEGEEDDDEEDVPVRSVSAMKSELMMQQAALEAMEAALQARDQETQSLQKELAEKERIIVATNTKLDELRQLNLTLHKTLEESAMLSEQGKNEILSLMEKEKKTRVELELAKMTIKEMRDSREKLQESFEEMEEQLRMTHDKVTSEERQLETSRSELHDHEAHLQTARIQLHAATAEMAEYKGIVEEREKERVVMQSQLEEIRREFEEQQLKLLEAQTAAHDHQQQLKDSQRKLEDCLKELEIVQQSLKDIQEDHTTAIHQLQIEHRKIQGDLEHKLEQSTGSMEVYQREVETCRILLMNAKREIHEMEEEREAMKNEIEKTKEGNSKTIQDLIAKGEAAENNHTQLLKDLVIKLEEKDASMRHVQLALGDKQADVDEKIMELEKKQQEIGEMTMELEKKQQEIDEMKSALESLTSELQHQNVEISSFQGKLKAYEDECAAVVAQVKDTSQHVTKLLIDLEHEKQGKHTGEVLATIENEVVVLKEVLSSKEEAMEAARDAMQQRSTETAQIQVQLQHKEEMIARLSNENETLRARHLDEHSSSSELVLARAEIGRLQKEISSYSKTVDQTDKDLMAARDELQRVKTDRDGYSKALEKTDKDLMASRDEISRLKKDKDNCAKTLEQTKDEVAKQIQENNEVRRALELTRDEAVKERKVLSDKMQNLEGSLAGAKEEILRLQKDKQGYNKILEKTEAQVHSLTEKLEAGMKEVSQCYQQLKQRDLEVEDLQQQCDRMQHNHAEQVAALQSTITNLTAEVDIMKKGQQPQNDKMTSLLQQLDDSRVFAEKLRVQHLAEVEEMKAVRKALLRERDQLAQDNKNLAAKVESLNEQVHTLTDSSSWQQQRTEDEMEHRNREMKEQLQSYEMMLAAKDEEIRKEVSAREKIEGRIVESTQKAAVDVARLRDESERANLDMFRDALKEATIRTVSLEQQLMTEREISFTAREALAATRRELQLHLTECSTSSRRKEEEIERLRQTVSQYTVDNARIGSENRRLEADVARLQNEVAISQNARDAALEGKRELESRITVVEERLIMKTEQLDAKNNEVMSHMEVCKMLSSALEESKEARRQKLEYVSSPREVDESSNNNNESPDVLLLEAELVSRATRPSIVPAVAAASSSSVRYSMEERMAISTALRHQREAERQRDEASRMYEQQTRRLEDVESKMHRLQHEICRAEAQRDISQALLDGKTEELTVLRGELFSLREINAQNTRTLTTVLEDSKNKIRMLEDDVESSRVRHAAEMEALRVENTLARLDAQHAKERAKASVENERAAMAACEKDRASYLAAREELVALHDDYKTLSLQFSKRTYELEHLQAILADREDQLAQLSKKLLLVEEYNAHAMEHNSMTEHELASNQNLLKSFQRQLEATIGEHQKERRELTAALEACRKQAQKGEEELAQMKMKVSWEVDAANMEMSIARDEAERTVSSHKYLSELAHSRQETLLSELQGMSARAAELEEKYNEVLAESKQIRWELSRTVRALCDELMRKGEEKQDEKEVEFGRARLESIKNKFAADDDNSINNEQSWSALDALGTIKLLVKEILQKHRHLDTRVTQLQGQLAAESAVRYRLEPDKMSRDDDVVTQMEEAKTVISRLRTELEKTYHRISVLEDAELNLISAVKANNEAHQIIQKLKMELRSSINESNEYKTKLFELEQEMAGLREELTTSMIRAEMRSTQGLQEKEETITMLQCDLKGMQARCDEWVDVFKNRLEKEEEMVQLLSKELEEARIMAVSTETKASTLEKYKDDWKQECQNMKSECAQMHASKESAEKKLAVTEAELKARDQIIQSLEMELQQERLKHADSEKARSAMVAAAAMQERWKEDSQEQMEIAVSQRMDELNKRLEEYSELLRQSKEHSKKQAAEMDTWKHKALEADRSIQAKEEEINELKISVQGLKEKMEVRSKLGRNSE